MLSSMAALGYVLYEQEMKGREIQSFMKSVQTWDQIDRANADLESGTGMDKQDRERLNELVLSGESDTIAFLSHIDQLGTATGVTVTTDELSSEKSTSPNFTEIAASLSLSGSKDAVESMIELLESMPYHSRIESLSLSRGPDRTEANVVLRVSAFK